MLDKVSTTHRRSRYGATWLRQQWADHGERILFLVVLVLLSVLAVLPFALGGGDQPWLP